MPQLSKSSYVTLNHTIMIVLSCYLMLSIDAASLSNMHAAILRLPPPSSLNVCFLRRQHFLLTVAWCCESCTLDVMDKIHANLPLHALKQIEILIDVAKAKLIARRDVQYLAALTNQCVGMRTRSLFWLLVVGAFCVPSSFSCAFHAGGVLLQCQYIVSSLPLSFLHRCLYLMLAPLLPYRMPSCMSSLRPQMTPTTQLLQCCWCCQKLGGVLWEGHLRFQSHDSNETKCVPTLSKDSINSIHCSTGTFTFGAPWKCENVKTCGKMWKTCQF